MTSESRARTTGAGRDRGVGSGSGRAAGDGRRSLAGCRVVVTRPRRQAGGLVERLRALGAVTIEIPVIEIGPAADSGRALARAVGHVAAGRYGTVIFTSANGVERFFAVALDPSCVAAARVVAIGKGTEAALAQYGVTADLLPAHHVAEGLLEALGRAPGSSTAPEQPSHTQEPRLPGAQSDQPSSTQGSARGAVPAPERGGSASPAGPPDRSPRDPSQPHDPARQADEARARRVLLARAAVARDVLPDGLRAAGWEVEVVEAYRTRQGTPTQAELARAAEADAVCFTSSSTVEHYLALTAGVPVPPIVVCIGPATAKTARAHGLVVTAVAAPHSIPGLVDALVAVVAP